MIGAAATPPHAGRCAQWGYDYNGNRRLRGVLLSKGDANRPATKQ